MTSFPKENVNVCAFVDPRAYISEVYKAAKGANKKFSFQKFSQYIGFGYNSYSFQIINGSRSISSKAIEKISAALEFSKAEKSYFEAICIYSQTNNSLEKENALKQMINIRSSFSDSDLSRSDLEYFSEWHHPVVREMISLPYFRPDPAWIADQLRPRISTKEAAYSFSLLQRIGYIEFDANRGQWINIDKNVSTPHEARSIALLRFHRQMIDLGKESLSSVPSQDREVGALTVGLTREDFMEVKASLKRLRKDIIKKQDSANINHEGRSIYQLNVQLFPITSGATE